MDALRSLPFGETCREEADNVFVFFFTELVRRVVAGVTGVVNIDLVCFGSVEATVTVPLEVLLFLLLDCYGLVRTGWLRVCCRGAGDEASATCPSAVMAAMILSSCLAFAGVSITLVAAAANSASTCSISSLEA